MTPDQELWAEALAVQRVHGDGAQEFVIGRIADLALADDLAGVRRWMAIRHRLKQLSSGALQ